MFKKKERTSSPQSTSIPTDLTQHPPPINAETGDTERARRKYLDSVKLLEEAIKSNEDTWGSFNYPELKGEPKDLDDSLFREKINAVIDARKSAVNDRNALAKCKNTVQCAFTAFSPFARNFLTIAKDVQAVFAIPYFSHQ
jgi:hypothetical protein